MMMEIASMLQATVPDVVDAVKVANAGAINGSFTLGVAGAGAGIGIGLTGFAAADFSRVRRANLGRFTVDRLMTMLDKLGQAVEVTVSDAPARPKPMAQPAPHP